MDWLAPLDNYCERVGPGLLAEPLNLISNLGFILAGLICLRHVRHTHYRNLRPGSRLLPILLIMIGVGSALFHSLANVWAMWADVIPISCFVFTYLWLFLRHTTKINILNTVLALVGFVGLSTGVAMLADLTVANGGEAYFGTWITLFGISSYYLGRKQVHNYLRMILATCLFAVSIFFRTIDLRVCEAFPTGTHVFWHLLNAGVLYLATMSFISERGKS
jgi:hypothetical protein